MPKKVSNPTSWRIRSWRTLFGALVAAFAVAACSVAVLIYAQQRAMSGTDRYDVSWSATKAGIELARLGNLAGLAMLEPDEPTYGRKVRIQHQILLGRSAGMEKGSFRDFLDGDPASADRARGFSLAVARMGPAVAEIGRPGSVEAIVREVDAAQKGLALLAASANTYYGVETMRDRQLLERCHLLFIVLLGGLLASGAVLLLLLRRARSRIEALAHRDYLTDLLNRRSISERIERLLSEGRTDVALVSIDLDRFKEVNDTFGHHVGDLLIREVSSRIAETTSPDTAVARLGGDEFCILMAGVDDEGRLLREVEAVLDAIRRPYDLDGVRVIVGASAGIALRDDTAIGPADLMRRSDTALYRSKNEHRGHSRLYEDGMERERMERRRYENDLRSSLERGELELHYQPIVDLADRNRVACREALLRWRHPLLGMISPATFVPIAEDNGSIVEIGDWVIHEACRTACDWADGAKVAVNLSPVQFRRSDVPALVRRALGATGIDPGRLELEITESVLVDDLPRMRETIHALHRMGVRVSMDDFGTGYSSLAYISGLPLDKLKIDRSFVMAIDEPQNREIVELVATLGLKLGMTVTAEGVETEEQAGILASLGCQEGQGYLFSRPVPADRIACLSRRELASAA